MFTEDVLIISVDSINHIGLLLSAVCLNRSVKSKTQTPKQMTSLFRVRIRSIADEVCGLVECSQAKNSPLPKKKERKKEKTTTTTKKRQKKKKKEKKEKKKREREREREKKRK